MPTWPQPQLQDQLPERRVARIDVGNCAWAAQPAAAVSVQIITGVSGFQAVGL